ncbi:MAG: hypothetical protein QFB89_08910, partial [Pseudomonadota bacterium]|nr:hypothetical protein [Pseudomonadota bacterium]
ATAIANRNSGGTSGSKAKPASKPKPIPKCKAKPKRKRWLALAGGDKPQLRQTTARSWSKAKAKEFLSVLAETCNVSEACRQSGIAVSAAYRRRKSDAGFRASWLETIAAAYQRLELVLLDRAFNGTEKLIKRRDGSEEVMMEYSNSLGLALLKLHHDSAVEADTAFEPDDIDELRARLINKLERMRKRDGGDEPGVETKADEAWRAAAFRKLSASAAAMGSD